MEEAILKCKKLSAKMKILLLSLVVLAAASAGAWQVLVVQNIAEAVTVEAGEGAVDPASFLIRNFGEAPSFVTDLSSIDWDQPGDYPVSLLYRNRTYASVVQIRDTVAPTATVNQVSTLSIRMPEPEAFIQEIRDVTQVTVAYAAEPDLTREGEQTVTLLLMDTSGNTSLAEAALTVIFDREAPTIEGAAPMWIYLRQEPDYEATISVCDDWDPSPLLTVDHSAVDLTQGGEYPVVYTARDASGNEVSVETTLTIVVDNEAPSILGVQPISLYAGSSVAYRSGILVTDDQDAAPVLTVDSSNVDLSQPGIYEVTYIATDAAGNQASITTSVTVKEQTDSYVDEETIYAAADALLEKIITADMTDREKVQAIYRWTRYSCSYISISDKTDWLQAAYQMLTLRYGDCFDYYAVSRLLFDRLGLPNLTVRRSEDSVRTTDHYWNMVSVDGGETYYHFDSTPRPSTSSGSRNFCLVTDAYLASYDQFCPGYYTRDLSLYPATPEE